MECQILFLWEKIEKNILKCYLLKFLPSLKIDKPVVRDHNHNKVQKCGPLWQVFS